MKEIKIVIMIIFATTLFTVGCEKYQVMKYRGGESVYFSVRSPLPWQPDSNKWPYISNQKVEFIKFPENEYKVVVSIAVTGGQKNYDRKVEVIINKDSTNAIEGVNYDPIESEYTIKAGDMLVNFDVNIKRAANLQDEDKVLCLQVIPNEYFNVTFEHWDPLPTLGIETFDATMHKVFMTNIMVQPFKWNGSFNPANQTEIGLWGAFTQTKIKLMFELFNLTYLDFCDDVTMPQARMNAIQNYMKLYLIEKYEAGDPLIEDDGRLMWVQGVPWSSVKDVAWIP